MTLLVTEAVVLHAFDYLESSRILRLATRDGGVRSVLARGARSSRKRFGSAVDLFAQGTAQIHTKPGRDLDTLAGIDVTRARPELAEDLGRFTGASALAELTLRCATEAADPETFDALVAGLDDIGTALPTGARQATLAAAWRLVAELGFAPNVEGCGMCHAELDPAETVRFSHPASGALCQRCDGLAPSGRALGATLRSRRARASTAVARVSARAPGRRPTAPCVRRLGARGVERSMILGLAGHIDHGKTALVRALTGVDTDRLAEEKRRGITIELGFAPLVLDGVGTIGVVDVPGHEAFVRTMLAGATGIDLALLVVAADEGVMPQTREHLAILQLLGVREAAVVLTKRDLVDDDWVTLVREDVESLLSTTPLAGSPIVETSIVSGQGIPELRRCIAALASRAPARDASDLFRLPVDRAFTIKGTGTVVTGTVWSGSLGRDSTVRVFPADRVVRVRTVQAHGSTVDQAQPGTRTALALVGVEVGDVERGTVIVEDHPLWRPTTSFRADVTLLDDAPRALRSRSAVRLHVGTSEVGARIVTRTGSLQPGDLCAARVVVDRPIVLRAGDRFVLRSASPVATIGGGVVTDPSVPSRAKPLPTVGMSAEARLDQFVREAGVEGVAIEALPIRLGVSRALVSEMVSTRPDSEMIGGRLVAADATRKLSSEIVEAVARYHTEHPLEPGASLQSVRASVGGHEEVLNAVVARLVAARKIAIKDGLVGLAGWEPRVGERERETLEKLLQRLLRAGAEPPSVGELEESFGVGVEGLLRFMERSGKVVQVEKGRYYEADQIKQLLNRLDVGMAAGRIYAPAELRDVLGVSRKYLIPFLEYCDKIGFTTRHQTGRMKRAV